MSENFIMLYKRCFELDENNLSPLCIFLFSHLYRNRVPYGDTWITYTNIYLIHSMIKCKVEGKGSKQLDTIRNVLIELKNKEYILCDVHSDTKYNELLSIQFPLLDNTQEGFKGFYQLPYSQFDMFDDREKLYIYTYIDSKFNQEKNIHYSNRLSLTKWSKLLHVSKNTAINKLSSMNRNDSVPRIYKFSGDYNGDTEQDENLYYTRPDEKLISRWNNLYDDEGKAKYVKPNNEKKYVDDDIIESVFEGDITVCEFGKVVEDSGWGKLNEDKWNYGSHYQELEYCDYTVYRTCKDYGIYPKFIKKCENIIKAKKRLDVYDGCFEKWEKLYIYDVSEDQSETDEIRMIQDELRQNSRYVGGYEDIDESDHEPFA